VWLYLIHRGLYAVWCDLLRLCGLVLLMIWLYLSWLIPLVVGAKVAFYRQNPQFLSIAPDRRITEALLIKQTAVSIKYLIASYFNLNKPPWSTQVLAQHLGLSPERIEGIIVALKKERLVAETVNDSPTIIPPKDIGTIRLREVYDAVRGSGRGKGRRAISAIYEGIVRSLNSATHGEMVQPRREIRYVGKIRSPHGTGRTPIARNEEGW
jgi:hypothetical protein